MKQYVKYIGKDMLFEGQRGVVSSEDNGKYAITMRLPDSSSFLLLDVPKEDVELLELPDLQDGSRVIYHGINPDFRNCVGRSGHVHIIFGRLDVRFVMDNGLIRVLRNADFLDLEVIPETNLELFVTKLKDLHRTIEQRSMKMSLTARHDDVDAKIATAQCVLLRDIIKCAEDSIVR